MAGVVTSSSIPLAKSSSSLRWLILVLASLLMLTNYFVYDIPASLKDLLRQNMGLEKSDFEPMYSLFYTVYSLPNIVLPFFGGLFVDRFGARVCLVAFTIFLVVGQLLFSFGSVSKNFPLMLIGRAIYGLGGENLSVGQSALVAEWFKGKELAFAFGINLSCSRLGSVINNFAEPEIADRWGGVNVALFFGVIVLLMGLVCGLVMAPVDKIVEKRLEDRAARRNSLVLDGSNNTELLDPLMDRDDKHKRSTSPSSSSGGAAGGFQASTTMAYFFKELRSFSLMFWILSLCCLVVYGTILPFNNIASSLLQERDYFKTPPPDCQLLNTSACPSATNVPNEACPSSKWYQPPLPTTVNVAAIDCSSPSFSDPGTCTETYCQRQKAGIKQSDRVMSIPYTISAVLSPFLGLLVDRFGMRAIVITFAPILLICVHLALAYWLTLSPMVPLIGQGLAYSAFAAVLWPSVPFTVPEEKVGLAYGLTTAIQNGGLALFPVVAAAIYKMGDSTYLPKVELLFVGLAALGVFCGLFLNLLDIRAGHTLNSAEWKGSAAGGSSSIDRKALLEVDVPVSDSPVYV